jgi:hypothetical protein
VIFGFIAFPPRLRSLPIRHLLLRHAILSAAVCTLGVALGCWGSGHPTKKVRGTITFQGAKPPKGGEVFFAPASPSAGESQRAAQGTFDENGSFELTSWEPGDGAAPGNYQVTITCWRETPTLETKESANYVPPDFSPQVTIDPKAKEPVEITLDVPKLQK